MEFWGSIGCRKTRAVIALQGTGTYRALGDREMVMLPAAWKENEDANYCRFGGRMSA